MTLEGVLKQQLSTIQALNDNIYPLCVPGDVQAPYIDYKLVDGKYLKSLDGEEPWEFTYQLNILSSGYENLKPLELEVYKVLKTMVNMQAANSIIKQVDVEVPLEQYEEATNLHRATLDFTIYF